MKISGVRVTKDLLIKNKAARALLKARAQCRDGLNELSIVMPRSLVESRSLIETLKIGPPSTMPSREHLWSVFIVASRPDAHLPSFLNRHSLPILLDSTIRSGSKVRVLFNRRSEHRTPAEASTPIYCGRPA